MSSFFVDRINDPTPEETKLKYNLTLQKLNKYTEANVLQAEPTGFVDRTATISFVDATRTFTITGNHIVYRSGISTEKRTNSLVLSDDAGSHIIYYNDSFVLEESLTFPGFNVPLVAIVYWNTVANVGILMDERHGIVMDHATHSLIHLTIGARYGDGLAGAFTDTTFSIAAGSIWDEDVHHEFDDAMTTCRLLYKNGTSLFVWDAAQTVYYKLVTASLQYNNGNTLTPVDANKYVAAWIFATNSVVTPIVAIIGQRQDTLLADARANNTYDSLSLSNLPFVEFKLLYRILLRNDGTPYVEAQDYRNVSTMPSSTYVASSHNALTGLQGGTASEYYHLTSAQATSVANGLAGTKVYYVADSSGGAVTRKLTFVNGLLTSEV